MVDIHGDYIFYADESGDHSLTSIDPTYPAFALSLCAFPKSSYCTTTIPRFLKLKFKYFGHDSIVLHEREIRKQTGDFSILSDVNLRGQFISELTDLLAASKFHVLAAVIDKPELKTDLFPTNPYSISLRICLQMAYLFLRRRRQIGKRHHFIFEKRGAKEDAELELEFRRIIAGENDLKVPFPAFQIHFSDKRTNSTGMQIADLAARPIGLTIIRPGQPNRAFEVIEKKLFNCKRFGRPHKGIHAL